MSYFIYWFNVIDGLSDETKQLLSDTKGRKQKEKSTTDDTEGEANGIHQRIRIVLKFKKYLFQEKTIIAQ